MWKAPPIGTGPHSRLRRKETPLRGDFRGDPLFGRRHELYFISLPKNDENLKEVNNKVDKDFISVIKARAECRWIVSKIAQEPRRKVCPFYVSDRVE
jgi:hypothetical protein